MEVSNTNQTSGYINSYYTASANATTERTRLEQNISADICVTGTGFSGLSSALHLVEKGYQVVLVESSRVGWGASGRNGGQIANGSARVCRRLYFFRG